MDLYHLNTSEEVNADLLIETCQDLELPNSPDLAETEELPSGKPAEALNLEMNLDGINGVRGEAGYVDGDITSVNLDGNFREKSAALQQLDIY